MSEWTSVPELLRPLPIKYLLYSAQFGAIVVDVASPNEVEKAGTL